MSPTRRREWVRWVAGAFQISERRACRAGSVQRSVIRYESIRPKREPLRRRLRELAHVRVSYGYRRLHVLLRREGWAVNHKLVHRLYTEEGLTQKRKEECRRARTTAAGERAKRAMGNGLHPRHARIGEHDSRAECRRDVFTREWIALVPQLRFRGEDVARCLSIAGTERGLPAVIQADNGTEFTSKALDHWAYWNHVRLDFRRLGKPTDNAHIESFHNSVRRECLTQHYFINLTDAERTLDTY